MYSKTIGVLLVLASISALVWLIIVSYNQNKNKSVKSKVQYLLFIIIGIVLNTSVLIIIIGCLIIGIALIIYP